MTTHVATVDTVSELPEPTEASRALVKSEDAVYVTKEINGALTWVLSVKLK